MSPHGFTIHIDGKPAGKGRARFGHGRTFTPKDTVMAEERDRMSQESSNVQLTDGAGDRYEVVGYDATFTLRSLDRPESAPFKVGSATLRTLGIEWDGRTLKAVG